MELISREQAIDAFNTNINELVVAGKENADSVERYLNRVIDEIKQLPPIQPKRGKWIDGIIPNDSGGLPVIVCDQCNTFFPLQFGDGHNFCPNCGADMRT